MVHWINVLRRELKRFGHHIVFLLSILSLALLITWWAIFINQSIDLQRMLRIENLETQLKFYAVQLGTDEANQPQPGVLTQDNSFEVISGLWGNGVLKRSLRPNWPGYYIKIRDEAIEELEIDFKLKKFMVFGESGFLALLILMGSFMLYKYIKIERRTIHEVEEFWGRVTHEIKTPITGIKSFLQSMKSGTIPQAQMPLFVDMALRQVEKQEQLAENLLTGFGMRYRERENKPFLKDLDLVEFMVDYFDKHAILLTDARLSIRFPGSDEPNCMEHLWVKADTHYLKIILDNLVDNALKYCSPGLDLRVMVSLQLNYAIISVIDNGPGIPSEYVDKIFLAFKYTPGELPGKEHGSGMGLYISRHLAKKMGGDLDVVANPKEKGTQFKIYLYLSKKNSLSKHSIKKDNRKNDL